MRYRKLRIAWSVVWALAAVLLIVLWVRSYETWDRLSGKVPGDYSPVLISHTGHLTVVLYDLTLQWKFPRLDRGPIHQNWYEDVVWPHRSFCGFGWCYHEYHRNTPNGERGWDPRGMTGRSWTHPASGIMLPHWSAALLFAALAFLVWVPWSLNFSLRTLLIATTLIAVGLGLIVWLTPMRKSLRCLRITWTAICGITTVLLIVWLR
jgi:hypothetical protein